MISKLDHPIIANVSAGYTDHFRDPKVWKDGEYFYALIGAQREMKQVVLLCMSIRI